MSILFSGGRKVDANGVVEGFWMLVDGGTIAATGTGDAPPAGSTVDLGGRVLVPGFIDLHCHGGGGHAFDDGESAIRGALDTHRAHGTTRSVVSLVANPMPDLRSSLAGIAALASRDPLVLGSHLEGPFLSAARRGAHHPAHLRTPARGDVDALLEAAAGTLRQVTIAPELPGAMAAIDALAAAGVTVAIGHTEAGYALARAAFDRGARLLTHAFNAMPGIHHRSPGPVVAAFDDERIGIEVILDGEHVHPAVARMAFRAAPGRIALVTDAMAAAGSGDGDYRLGPLGVTVRDGVARLVDGPAELSPSGGVAGSGGAAGSAAAGGGAARSAAADGAAAGGGAARFANGLSELSPSAGMGGSGSGAEAHTPGRASAGAATAGTATAGAGPIAGSTLTQDAALRHAIGAGIDPVEAVAALTRTPARVLGLDARLGVLAPGFAADAVLLNADWTVDSVWAAGVRLR